MAKKDNIQISFGINGMERQGFSHLIDEKTYTFMQNGNIETDDESIALTNEQSNFKSRRFGCPGWMGTICFPFFLAKVCHIPWADGIYDPNDNGQRIW